MSAIGSVGQSSIFDLMNKLADVVAEGQQQQIALTQRLALLAAKTGVENAAKTAPQKLSESLDITA